MRRGGVVESRHRGHVVQVDLDGSLQLACGDPDVVVTLRSTVKPFALVALVEAGGIEEFALGEADLAIMAGSHSGEDMHVRTIQAIFRRATLSQALLACGSEGAPLDPLTAARLAREGESPGPVRHMCSGAHAASILLSKLAGWSLEDYWLPEHPSQVAARAIVGRVFDTRPERLVTAVDGCGVLTYAVPLLALARAYALLADPAGAVGALGRRSASTAGARSSLVGALTRIRDAMAARPEMVGGTRDRLDSALMKACPGVLAKGGNEALRGLAILPGTRPGSGGRAAGMAIKIEDGDGRGRAGWSVAVEALARMELLDERALRTLARYHRPPVFDPHGRQTGEAVPQFELAPISELS